MRLCTNVVCYILVTIELKLIMVLCFVNLLLGIIN